MAKMSKSTTARIFLFSMFAGLGFAGLPAQSHPQKSSPSNLTGASLLKESQPDAFLNPNPQQPTLERQTELRDLKITFDSHTTNLPSATMTSRLEKTAQSRADFSPAAELRLHSDPVFGKAIADFSEAQPPVDLAQFLPLEDRESVPEPEPAPEQPTPEQPTPDQPTPELDLEQPPDGEPPSFGGSILERQKLGGDWGGLRTYLLNNGIILDITSTNFGSGVLEGGLERTWEYRGRIDYSLTASLWNGAFLKIHAESVFGTSIDEFTGTLLPVSLAQSLPVEVGSITSVTGVMLSQFLSENLLVYLGKINTLDDFNQPFTGGGRGVNGFQNAAFLFNPVYTRTFPYSTFGAGIVLLNEEQEVFVTAAVFDTNNTPTESGFDTFFDNGVTLYGAVNVPTKLFGLPGHQNFSATYSNADYTDLQGITILNIASLLNLFPDQPFLPLPVRSSSWSLAYAFDQAIYVSPDNPQKSWGVFGNLGLADKSPSPFRWSANIGIGGSSPFPGRDLDTFGIGFFYVGVNDSIKQFLPRLLPVKDEYGWEFFYNLAVTPWFRITSDLQIVNPALARVQQVVVFTIRAKVDF